MSDSANPFGTIALGQTDQVALANSLFDAVSPASLYGLDRYSTSGVVLALYGGKVLINGTLTDVAAPSLTLSVSTTNYVQADITTGVASSNTTGYSAGYWPIGRAVTGTESITTWYDDRWSGGFQPQSFLAKTLPSDANYTLTVPESRNAILSISGTLTTQRTIYLPRTKQQWTVYNGTGQTLLFAGATGGGVTVATLKRAIIYDDGTNIVRVTADT